MNKIDYKKEWKQIYKPSSKQITIVEVPEMNVIALDGRGHPMVSGTYQDAIDVLMGMSYTAKFTAKARGMEPDYAVMPLETRWHEGEYSMDNMEDWRWTMMMVQPPHLPAEFFEEVKGILREKKNPPLLDQLRFEKAPGGLAAVAMHLGPFDKVGDTYQRLKTYIEENGYQIAGDCHEIYLSDPRRCKAANLKTSVRFGVEKMVTVHVV